MRAGFRVDELRVDTDAVLVALRRAFEHIADAELLADLLRVDALPLKGESRVARDHEAVADAREISCQVLGDAVGKIILGGIAREICERQDHDGQVRGFGWRGRDDSRSSASRQEIPYRTGDQYERDDPDYERRFH